MYKRQGYIWYGTAEGLCRDDGYNIHTFRSDFKDPDMMPSNVITCLGEDSITHNIWIGTDKGLYILNKQTYTIASADIAELKDINIEGIIVTSDHSIWINVYRRTFRLSPEGEILKIYSLQCSPGPGEEYVCLLYTSNPPSATNELFSVLWLYPTPIMP